MPSAGFATTVRDASSSASLGTTRRSSPRRLLPGISLTESSSSSAISMLMPRRAHGKPLDGHRVEMRREHLTAAITLALAYSAPAGFAADTPEYAGAAVCGSCHAAEYEAQSRSAHAKS